MTYTACFPFFSPRTSTSRACNFSPQRKSKKIELQ